MKFPFYETLCRIDRHWLLNYPVLWIMKLHWIGYIWFIGFILISMIALVFPVSLRSAIHADLYFLVGLLFLAMMSGMWVDLQSPFDSQLRQNYQARTAIYLVAGHLLVFCSFMSWPYVFWQIIVNRISGEISEGVLRRDLEALRRIYPVGSAEPLYDQERMGTLKSLSSKYLNKLPSAVESDARIAADIEYTIRTILANKGVWLEEEGLEDSEMLDVLAFARFSIDWLVLVQVSLLLTLVMRSAQITSSQGMFVTFFLACAVLSVGAYSFGIPSRSVLFWGTLLALFAAGGYAAFRAPGPRQRGVLFAAGLNTFVLLLPWTPCLILLISTNGRASKGLYGGLFFVGLSILLSVAPWVRRQCLALKAKPH